MVGRRGLALGRTQDGLILEVFAGEIPGRAVGGALLTQRFVGEMAGSPALLPGSSG